MECAVPGNSAPKVSGVGEVVVKTRFYSYGEKYNSTSTAEIIIPAKLTQKETVAAKKLALEVYETLCCKGLARVICSFQGGRFYVNEINTIPGFTNMSMYPKLWEAEGLSYTKLVSTLLELAVKRD